MKRLFLVCVIILLSTVARAVDRQSFGNLMTQMSFNAGIPFEAGDIVSIPAGMLDEIARENRGDKIIYLVGMVSRSDNGKPIYLISSRELKFYNRILAEPIRIKCRKVANYRRGLHETSTWMFEVE